MEKKKKGTEFNNECAMWGADHRSALVKWTGHSSGEKRTRMPHNVYLTADEKPHSYLYYPLR